MGFHEFRSDENGEEQSVTSGEDNLSSAIYSMRYKSRLATRPGEGYLFECFLFSLSNIKLRTIGSKNVRPLENISFFTNRGLFREKISYFHCHDSFLKD